MCERYLINDLPGVVFDRVRRLCPDVCRLDLSVVRGWHPARREIVGGCATALTDNLVFVGARTRERAVGARDYFGRRVALDARCDRVREFVDRAARAAKRIAGLARADRDPRADCLRLQYAHRVSDEHIARKTD